MKRFFTTLFRWLGHLRSILINAVFLVLLLLVVFAVLEETPEMPDHAVLLVNPSGQMVEELELPSSGALPGLDFTMPDQTNIHDVVKTITAAAADDRIQMLVLKLDEMDKTSLSKLQDIARAITVFKQSHKQVVAIGPNYSQSQYYLAAMADQVFLDPMGLVALQGFGIYRNYFKSALDKLHVRVELFRAGKYKAAIEPLIRNDMSPEDRVANTALLSVLWSAYKDDVAAVRGISADRLQSLLDHPADALVQYDGDYAALFKAEGLVDSLAGHYRIESYIAKAMGDVNYSSIDFHDYLSFVQSKQPADKQQQVGIITASGMIVDGEKPPGMVGSDTMIDILDRARLNPKIKAVVLRIDSPGGSAQASEVIRNAIIHLQASGKPVVVSMGSLAASGGYWIAAPADQIWASPTTITGSIGAFGVMANVEGSLNALGIHTDGVGTTTIAAGIRPDMRMPAELRQVMGLAMKHTYRRFLSVVAEGRSLSIDAVAALAEGRVWSGLDAQRLGLVDDLGSFDDAIEAAAKLADIENDYSVVSIQPTLNLQEMLLLKLFGSVDALASRVLSQNMAMFESSLLKAFKLDVYPYSQVLSLDQPRIFTLCDVQVSQ